MELYCIDCGKIVDAEPMTTSEYIHEIYLTDDYGQMEIDWCEFPLGYTTSEPPITMIEDYDEWLASLNEPTDEELREMDVLAEELLLECIA